MFITLHLIDLIVFMIQVSLQLSQRNDEFSLSLCVLLRIMFQVD